MTAYKEIPITAPKVETPVEDGSKMVDIPAEEALPGAVEAVVETKVEPAAVVEPVVAEKKPERKSGARERIRQLHFEKSEVEGRLQASEAEKTELRKQLLQGHTLTKESFKTTLESQIKSLTSQMTSAMTNGDAALTVALQDQLINAKMELASLTKELTTSYAEQKHNESVSESPRPQQNKVPERALEWIEDHPEFKTDVLFQHATILENNQLLREGFNPEDDEFYQEIDKRLSKRFPELVGVQQGNSVQLSGSPSATSPSQAPQGVKVEVVDVPSTNKVRTVEQTVSGSSRPSANSIPTRKTTQVRLSAEDVAQANAWGMDLEQMARRIAHSEANKGANGYVPINMKK